MKLEPRSARKLEHFTAQMVTVSKSEKIFLTVLVLFILAGVYALIVQIVDGHIATGMRDNVVWGIYIANFIFFIGIS